MNGQAARLGFFCAMLLAPTTAFGQSDGTLDEQTQTEQEAKKLREEGRDKYEARGQYDKALEKYQESLSLRRTAGTMYYMAKALSSLKKYDEALFWYETVLLEFPNASLTLRNEAAKDVAEMKKHVGIVSVEGDVVEGARLFIDKRDLGTLPLRAPVYALPGFHEVRAEKRDFPPIIVSVTVTAGKPSVARLVAKEQIGRLKIREKHNWVMRVEIDGQDMGATPGSQLLPIGKHRVRLRGFMQPTALLTCEIPEQEVESGARLESEAQDVTVGLYETKTIELSAEDLDTALRVESVPKVAALRIDDQDFGKTSWEGRLPLGEHVVEVSAPGFVTEKQRVHLERRKQRTLTLRLDRIPDPPSVRAVGSGAAFGVGLLGLGVFAVTGSIALKTSADLKRICVDGLCPGASEDDLIRARGLSRAAVGGLIAAGVGGLAGTIILLTTKRPPGDSTPRQTALHLDVGLGGASVNGAF